MSLACWHFFRVLVPSFPDASIRISVAVGGTRYIFAVTSAYQTTSSPQAEGRTIIVHINIRLDLDGVNPIYYDRVKVRDAFFLSYAFNQRR